MLTIINCIRYVFHVFIMSQDLKGFLDEKLFKTVI